MTETVAKIGMLSKLKLFLIPTGLALIFFQIIFSDLNLFTNYSYNIYYYVCSNYYNAQSRRRGAEMSSSGAV